MPTKNNNQRPVLRVAGLEVRRGQTSILAGIDWQVDPGRHWAVLGANGSGKTSLLSALTGYLAFSGGQVEVLGERYGEYDWRELRKRIGLVSSAIRRRMAESETALETIVSGKYAMIDYWGEIRPEDRRAAARILKQIECGHLSQRPWAFLSQGERQRVLIGRALMAKPRLLILDEPCAGLDPAAREHFLQFLQRLGKQSNAPTLILVTHHVEEITPVFSHVLILKEGRVLRAGPKEDVMKAGLLSEAFSASVKLVRRGGRYWMRVASAPGAIV